MNAWTSRTLAILVTATLTPACAHRSPQFVDTPQPEVGNAVRQSGESPVIDEVSRARKEIEAAKRAEAAIYAPESFAAAIAAVERMEAEVRVQESKQPRDRSNRETKSLAERAFDAATTAATQAESARAEAWADAEKLVAEARALSDRLPRNDGFLPGPLDEARWALFDAERALRERRYLEAKDRATFARHELERLLQSMHPPMAAPPGDRPPRERPYPSPVPPKGPPRASGVSGAAPRPTLVDKNLRFVRVYYGTNRARTADCASVSTASWKQPGGCDSESFYGRPGMPQADDLEVGTATVTFPQNHAAGKIERPLTIFTFAVRDEDPDEDVVLSTLESFGGDYDRWVSEIKATGRQDVFIYVHGYATTFSDAALRAAQVAYDLDFDVDERLQGLVMFFSWPSQGTQSSYLTDYDTSEGASAAFLKFLTIVKDRAGMRRVHVIAHSMGNRVVANALRDGQLGGIGRKIDQLILAAPDIPADDFQKRFLNVLPRLAERVTLYVSDKDIPLDASGKARDVPRAGTVAGGLLRVHVTEGRFDAVDASPLPKGFLNHSYYAKDVSMLSDMFCLLLGAPIEQRPLLIRQPDFWRFRTREEAASWVDGSCQAPSIGPLTTTSRWKWWLVASLIAAVTALLAFAALQRMRRARPDATV